MEIPYIALLLFSSLKLILSHFQSNNVGGPMTSADWKLDPTELESKFSSKTKILFLNNPNNPLGKVRFEYLVNSFSFKFKIIF